MNSLNRLMNHVDGLSNSNRFIVRTVSTRLVSFSGGVPFEILASLQNLVKLPFQPFGLACKYAIKVINFVFDSTLLGRLENGLPGFTDIIKTALKVIGYALGAVFTTTLGVLSPRANFLLHCACGLIENEKVEAEKRHAQIEAARLREAQEIALQAQIHSLVIAMRKKIAEQERHRAEEALKQKKAIDLVNAVKIEDRRMQGAKEHQLSIRVSPPEDNFANELLKKVWKRGTRFFGYTFPKRDTVFGL